MMNYSAYSAQLQVNGFCVINNVFSRDEIAAIATAISATNTDTTTFRKTEDLFAIRQFLKTIPCVVPLTFNNSLKQLITTMFGSDYFVVKSIYFDKPPASNWFVARHQDLTLSVDRKLQLEGFGPWTVKQNQYAVQPPLPILEDNFTIRIHLDDTDENNGALKVLPGSHTKGVYYPGNTRSDEKEETCTVQKGGIMIMKPLLVHASGRSTNGRRRRVIHIEFSRKMLPEGLQWSEKLYWW